MSNRKYKQALHLYLTLGAIFIASLVGCNLIFQKFFYWEPLMFLSSYFSETSTVQYLLQYRFEISVGIIAYPVTFLVTDMISEIFGKKKANQIVVAGLISATFIYLMITVAIWAPATDWSPVNEETFEKVFGLTGPAVFASMVAYLMAQFIDIRIYHFWKKLTKGRKLWLRNNFSTIPSQLIDTAVVLVLLCLFGKISWERYPGLLINGFLFKVLFALIDTPLLYLVVIIARNYFNLKPGEEMKLDVAIQSKIANE